MRDGVGASGGVKTLLLLISDFPDGLWASASLSCSMELNGELTQELRWVVQDSGAIAMRGLNVILPNGLADPLGMELLKLYNGQSMK